MNNRVRSIKMVIQTYYPRIGGAEKQCLELSKGLIERGIRVEILTERWKGLAPIDEVEGVPIRRLGPGGPNVWNSVAFMMSTFLYLCRCADSYDVIHVHLAASHAVAAALVGRIFRKRVVILVGGGSGVGEIASSRSTFSGRLKLRALGMLKPLLVILNESQRLEFRGYGLDKVPVTSIPNGVDLNRYRPIVPEKKESLRKRFGWRGIVFLYTGRFSPDKIPIEIFENFLKGWAAATRSVPGITFYMVGEGPLKEQYQTLIDRYGLGGSVQLLAARPDVSECYQAADVFVLPSVSEGLSNSLLEAMASSLPLLVSRVPGNAEIVRDGVNGFLFDPGSPADIEKRLRDVIDQPSKWDELGKGSVLTAVRYSIAQTIDDYIKLYSNPSPNH